MHEDPPQCSDLPLIPQPNVWGSVTICGPNSRRMGLRSDGTTPNMDLLCLVLQRYKFSSQSKKYSNPTQLKFLSFFSLVLQLASFVFIQYMMDLSHLTPEQVTQLGICTGLQYPQGLWVRVPMGMGTGHYGRTPSPHIYPYII